MDSINRTILPVAVIASLTLVGCSSVEGDFPSLAKRPFEKANPVEEQAAVAEILTTTMPADLQRQVNALLTRSSAAHLAFKTSLPSLRSAIQSAGNPAPGSESWINAHMVLSRTDSTRADGVAALGEIDQLIASQREKGADAGLIALLVAPQQKIAERVNAENTEIERLTQLIGL
jgi:hypothetical protein